MDDTLHRLGLMRFRWLLLGAVAVGCSLNPQPDLPAPRGGEDSPGHTPSAGGSNATGGAEGPTDAGSGAASSGGGSINAGGDLPCDSGAGGECDAAEAQGGVPANAGAGTVTAKDAGVAGAEDVQ
jgi:hypothetical protein